MVRAPIMDARNTLKDTKAAMVSASIKTTTKTHKD
jgi:hypothetical protein